jgi:hypothetical protein
MSTPFEERERGYEAKWAHDEEMHFKIMSLRNARLARWAGELMTLPATQLDQYAQTVVAAGLSDQKSDPIFAKIKKDLAAYRVTCPDSALREKMKELYTQAEKELTSS